MHRVSTEPSRKLIRATLSGFLTKEDVRDFADAVQKAVAAMGCGTNDHLLLADISGCVLQAQDVVAAFRDIIEHSPRKARRLAVVTGGSLARRQADRIMTRDEASVFASIDEAEAWLFARPAAVHYGQHKQDHVKSRLVR